MNNLALPVIALLLSGCADLGTQFKAADEPKDGARARLRVVANMLVKAVPEKACIDWSAPGAGTVFGGIFGSSGYRGRSLNMPGAPRDGKSAGELYVTADKPFTLVLLTTPEGVAYNGRLYQCSVSGSFVPEENKDYEASIFIEPAQKSCSIKVVELGSPSVPVPVKNAERCQ
ncbi:hypothetical protein [Herbaspirillum robiniae]|uniref:Lipoprotein n=1 Tax=Herbaspirillum robiniae TaxID=2014887 RepID=A0ABX2LUC9_9BURK|nr:hypothetical protein [Herbaspirillum robiniae]NUU00760.1 hypothetical protein [Herbaspirillum robiniae]